MLVGTGPLGSGATGRAASIALSRLSRSVISAGATWRLSLPTYLTSFGSGTWPSRVADDDLVDRRLGGDPLVAAALGGQQRLEAAGVALADQHDAGRTDDAVHDVLLLVERDGRLGLPAAPQRGQGGGGGAGPALDLRVRRGLGPPGEDHERAPAGPASGRR